MDGLAKRRASLDNRVVNLQELFDRDPRLSALHEKVEVSAIIFDTRKLVPNCVFVAIRGGRHDGHQFLNEAEARGAVALVVEDASRVPASFKGFVREVSSTRAELSKLAAIWTGRPSQKLFTVGVTGTNGKTTTTNMIEAVLTYGGLSTGVIGTIDHHLGTRVWPTEMTTPDPLAFQERLAEFAALGAKAVALEASSHALDQARVEAVEFDVGVFTNLTRDHLDYHVTMDGYFAAKRRFFTELLVRSAKPDTYAIVNSDDVWGARLVDELGAQLKANRRTKPKVWTYGWAEHGDARTRLCDFEYDILEQGFDGVRFSLRSPAGLHTMKLAMAGLHNVQNAMGAFATGLAAGMDARSVAAAIEAIRGVNGRLEHVPNAGGLHVFVDYAHTDDALSAILRLLQGIRMEAKAKGRPGQDARILTVFGCGGDRDKGKRPLMMRAALDGSDRVIVTSDNPRTEDPEAIIDDAMAAVKPDERSKVERLTDRRAAIRRAVEIAKDGDVILIAGKGHEPTQTIGTVKTAFSDAHVAREILEEAYGRTRN